MKGRGVQEKDQESAEQVKGQQPSDYADKSADLHMASRRVSKRRSRSHARTISNVLLGVGITLLLVAAGMWGYAQWQYAQQDAENAKLAGYATVHDKEYRPPQVDWAGLKAVNKDVVGWIHIPNTAINYPVYQTSDNEHYLTTNAEGSRSVGGQIFMDCENTASSFTDHQVILYGHHLKNGAMFKAVADMDNQGFFNSIKTVWYVTPTESYELKPLLVYYAHEEDTTVRQFNFASDEVFRNYLRGKLVSAVTSCSDAEEVIKKARHVLTLLTCNYVEGFGRTVLVCVPTSEIKGVSGS